MKNIITLLFMLGALLSAGPVPVQEAVIAYNQQIQSEAASGNNTLIAGDAGLNDQSGDTVNNGSFIRNPTFQEVKDFILKDTTSHNQFVLNKYECRHFATDVDNNADKAGIRCAFVLLCYSKGQHAVIGFDTIDRGMIYIEPQTDAVIKPVVGGYYQGQEIIEILVSW